MSIVGFAFKLFYKHDQPFVLISEVYNLYFHLSEFGGALIFFEGLNGDLLFLYLLIEMLYLAFEFEDEGIVSLLKPIFSQHALNLPVLYHF